MSRRYRRSSGIGLEQPRVMLSGTTTGGFQAAKTFLQPIQTLFATRRAESSPAASLASPFSKRGPKRFRMPVSCNSRPTEWPCRRTSWRSALNSRSRRTVSPPRGAEADRGRRVEVARAFPADAQIAFAVFFSPSLFPAVAMPRSMITGAHAGGIQFVRLGLEHVTFDRVAGKYMWATMMPRPSQFNQRAIAALLLRRSARRLAVLSTSLRNRYMLRINWRWKGARIRDEKPFSQNRYGTTFCFANRFTIKSIDWESEWVRNRRNMTY